MGGVWPWTPAQWEAHDFYLYRYPEAGGFLSPLDLQKRDTFHVIAFVDWSAEPPQYVCSTYGLSRERLPATIVEVYNANNGWLPASYPNRLYGRKGPCGLRMRWDYNAFGQNAPCSTLAYHLGEYYCRDATTPGESCTSDMNAFIGWFYNHPDVVAQPAICSSYGLLQVMYVKAVKELRWRESESGEARDPAFLLEACESLDMGCKFDAEEIAKQIPVHPGDLLAFQQAIENGIQKYNYKEKRLRASDRRLGSSLPAAVKADRPCERNPNGFLWSFC